MESTQSSQKILYDCWTGSWKNPGTIAGIPTYKMQIQQKFVNTSEVMTMCLFQLGWFPNQNTNREKFQRTIWRWKWYLWMWKKAALNSVLFGRVMSRKAHTSCHNLVKTCLQPNNFSSEATDHGIFKENVAVEKFQEETTLQVEKSGLWIDLKHGFLAALPDSNYSTLSTKLRCFCVFHF